PPSTLSLHDALPISLAQQPNMLLLDEPTSALDIRHQLEVLEIVHGLAKRSGILVVLILHDLELAARYSDVVYMLKDGTVFANGTDRKSTRLNSSHVK